MYVTKLTPVTKAEYKVYLDDKFAFVLYKGELSLYGIQEGKELPQGVAERIKEEVLKKRAKLRAMHILERADRTEAELYGKLKQDMYPEDVIACAMHYVKSFGYVGDADYARRFVESKQRAKSKREIACLLQQKGISSEYIEEALENCYEESDEKDTIKKLIDKKHFCADEATEQEKKKMFDYLLRKGFRYEDIRQVIQVSLWNA